MNRWTFSGPWKCPDYSIYMTKESSPEIGAPFLFSEFFKTLIVLYPTSQKLLHDLFRSQSCFYYKNTCIKWKSETGIKSEIVHVLRPRGLLSDFYL